MKERQILFNDSMVQAILEGRKMVTRRAVRNQPGVPVTDAIPRRNFPHGPATIDWYWRPKHGHLNGVPGGGWDFKCPFGQPGDRLWVRETWARIRVAQAPDQEWVVYRECDNRTDYGGPWKPGIHMFRRDSRILLEITDVRVERLQDISEEQARAEGITDGGCTSCGNNEPCGCDCPAPSAVDSFYHLWNSINGAGAWEANPWVWVVEFKRVTP